MDYVLKPFSPMELAARIRTVLRRREVSTPLESYVNGDLTFDFARRRVTLAGQPMPLVPLTSLEYRLQAYADDRPMRHALSSLRRKLSD